METNNKKIVAYGSLYLDRGERMAVVKRQVKNFAKRNPAGVYFDILDNRYTVADAFGQMYVEKTINYIKETLPYLKDEEISVSFSRAD